MRIDEIKVKKNFLPVAGIDGQIIGAAAGQCRIVHANALLIALINLHLLLVGAAHLPIVIAEERGKGNIASDHWLQQPVQGILHLFLAVAAPEGDAVAFDLISCKDDEIRFFPVKRSVHELERIRRNSGNLLQIGNLHHLEAPIRPDA